MTTTLIIGLLIPLLGTMLGFASGVMAAASVWSLLIPSMEMMADSGGWSVMPAAVGFLLGMGFLLMIDELTPHQHIGTDKPGASIKTLTDSTPISALSVSPSASS